jgi:hypothetical protein
MTLFKAIDPKMEVNGQTVLATVAAFQVIKDMGVKILAKHGFGTAIKPDGWYSQQSWLDAFKEIHDTMGETTLYQIGRKIPESAKFPPNVTDAHSALAIIDVAFHMNHGKEGVALFDPATGKMQEGIGHYRYVMMGPHAAKIVCDNPYPDDFDRGIITAMAERFAKNVTVTIATAGGTRASGMKETTYDVTWQ